MAEEALLNLPTDAFVEILLRVPSPKRWLLRRVCRRWRDVIRDRTPAPCRPTPLAFVVSYNADGLASSACAYAIDDPEQGRCTMEEPIEEASENIKHQEFRSEEASAQIKDSKVLQLRALDRMQLGKAATESTSLLASESELDGLYQEKIEAEIQCIILTAANETWATLACDQMALYEAQKSLTEDYKQLGLKLQHTENRATMLEEMAEKLQVPCKELSSSSEILQLQSKASTQAGLRSSVSFSLYCCVLLS